MEIKSSTSFRAPVRLVANNGNPVTGVAYTDPFVFIQKQGGAVVVKTLSNSDWFELSVANMPGVYDLLLSSADTDTAGFLKYYISHTYATYLGVLEIVDRVESETYAQAAAAASNASTAATNASNASTYALQASTNASAANINAALAATRAQTIITTLGTPTSGSIAADIKDTRDNVGSGGGGTAAADVSPIVRILGTPIQTIANDLRQVGKIVQDIQSKV